MAAVGLGGDHELLAVRREPDLARCVEVRGCEPAGEAEGPGASRNGGEAVGVVALHLARASGVQDIDEVATKGHTDRRRASGGHHSPEPEERPEGAEGRDRITAAVDGDEEPIGRVEGQASLGSEVVDDGPTDGHTITPGVDASHLV